MGNLATTLQFNWENVPAGIINTLARTTALEDDEKLKSLEKIYNHQLLWHMHQLLLSNESHYKRDILWWEVQCGGIDTTQKKK